MQLFYTPDIGGDRYALSEEESKHCVCVLRLGPGAPVALTDGRGNLYRGRLVCVANRRCEVEITSVEREYGKRNYYLQLAVAPTKSTDRCEWLLEKATEIGVDRITPLLCEHSERRVWKTDRGAKIITAAVKQSLKTYHPVLDELTPFEQLLKTPFDGDRFIAHCHEGDTRKLQRDALTPGGRAQVLIGPEGDFSPREVALAREVGFIEISLGQSRLRTETAAVVACHTFALMNENVHPIPPEKC
jgi:16S rRNA (uracil1498-N3)-methyltransferase